MKVDKDVVNRVASIARINLNVKEIESLIIDFTEILDVCDSICKVNTDKVKPSFQPVTINSQVRDDIVEPGFTQDEVLSNTQNKKDGYFKGPKVL